MPDRLALLPLPTLRGERVILRKGRDSDVDDRLRHPITRKKKMATARRGGASGIAAATTFARTWLPARARPLPASIAGPWSTKATAFGSAGLRVDPDQHCATYTVGLFVAGLRGQGLGQEITRLVLAWAFTVLGVHRVELEVLASNSRAIGCYRACGFRQEGIRRQAGLYPDGWKDFIVMAMLQSEYADGRWVR